MQELMSPSTTKTVGSALRVALCAALLLLLSAPGVAHAQSIIKQPGNHANYSVEIEPHLALQWSNRWGGDEGIGPGVRFNIPFMHNGPISKINNNMGISFGLDITFGDAGPYCWGRYRNPDFLTRGEDCDIVEFWLPVAMQWNFYLTKVISVFGEPGLAIVHRRADYRYFCDGRNALCDYDDTDTEVEPVLWGGGRFMFSDSVGATVRIGFPMITAGINILL